MGSKNVGAIPVIDNEQTRKLVGIITDRDLLLKVVAEGFDAKCMKVEAIMTRKVVTCRPGADLQKAPNAMTKHQFRRIAVVNSDDKILGIISHTDVAIRYNHSKKTASVIKGVSRNIAN